MEHTGAKRISVPSKITRITMFLISSFAISLFIFMEITYREGLPNVQGLSQNELYYIKLIWQIRYFMIALLGLLFHGAVSSRLKLNITIQILLFLMFSIAAAATIYLYLI